ncbi:hypothetical protein D3C87_1644590 [compost metagenome]
MHGEGNIVVDTPYRPVTIPAIADIKCLYFVEICMGLGRVEFDTHPLQPEIDQNAEKLPVIIDEFPLARRQKVDRDGLSIRFRKRLPDVFGNHGECKAYCRQLHQSLVPVCGVTPIFGVGRVGAIGQSAPVEIPVRKVIAAGGKGYDAP